MKYASLVELVECAEKLRAEQASISAEPVKDQQYEDDGCTFNSAREPEQVARRALYAPRQKVNLDEHVGRLRIHYAVKISKKASETLSQALNLKNEKRIEAYNSAIADYNKIAGIIASDLSFITDATKNGSEYLLDQRMKKKPFCRTLKRRYWSFRKGVTDIGFGFAFKLMSLEVRLLDIRIEQAENADSGKQSDHHEEFYKIRSVLKVIGGIGKLAQMLMDCGRMYRFIGRLDEAYSHLQELSHYRKPL